MADTFLHKLWAKMKRNQTNSETLRTKPKNKFTKKDRNKVKKETKKAVEE